VARFAFLAALSAVVALCARPAAAGGGAGVTTTTSESSKAAVADSQRIVFALHDAGLVSARTEIIAQIGVPGAGADYGVVIPVPGRPDIDPQPIAMHDLDALDNATKPSIVTVHEAYGGGCGFGFGCGCVGAAGDNSGKKGDEGGAASSVSVTAPVDVGPATAVVLESDDGSALTAWLAENGFAIPSDQQSIVDHYVSLGDAFIAIKRSDSAPPDGPSSLGLHYTLRGDQRQLSLMFARIGAAPTVSFTVFVMAPTLSFPASPFAMVELPDLSPNTLRTSYSAAVAEAVANRNSQAFVIEGTYGAPLLGDPSLTGPLSGLSAPFRDLLGVDGAAGNLTTRASTIVSNVYLTTDVRLDTPGFDVPNNVRLEPMDARLPSARESGVGVLSLVAGARAVRRRRRRRRNAAPAAHPARDLL